MQSPSPGATCTVTYNARHARTGGKMFTATRALSTLLATSLLLGVAACDDDDDGTNPTPQGRVRVVHAIGNGPAIDALIDGQALAGHTNVAFKANPAYVNVATGTRDFVLRQTGTQTAVLTANDQAVASGVGYSLVALGRAGATGALAPAFRYVTDAATPAQGKATLRLLHASPAAGNVDIYITAPNADLAAEEPDFSNVAFNAAPSTASLDAGTYRVRLTTTGTKTVKIDRTDIALTAGQRWLGIAVGDDAPGTGNTSAFEILMRQEGN